MRRRPIELGSSLDRDGALIEQQDFGEIFAKSFPSLFVGAGYRHHITVSPRSAADLGPSDARGALVGGVLLRWVALAAPLWLAAVLLVACAAGAYAATRRPQSLTWR
ncbi:MAG: hypothetical protein WAN44_02230 [Propionibacteriaceae bacterium]